MNETQEYEMEQGKDVTWWQSLVAIGAVFGIMAAFAIVMTYLGGGF